ncbi:MAG: hypothetical protein CMI50_16460 [Paracoccus sp.]|nr:hypothetical protein [Croceicoccus sp.]MAN58035.1 hypothetical protein [Paracoccus sp. (in: a-proteobacteria)]|tara:strand:- start:13354 stop:13758 length:405 start_codon:yes stop_codon:yes gene_type:complete
MNTSIALRVIRLAAIVAVVAIVGVCLNAGEPPEHWWWIFALPLMAWMVGPAIAAYAIAKRRPSLTRIATMGIYMAAFMLTSAVAYYDGLIAPQSSTAGLVTIFLPLYQWGALIAVFLALVAFEWIKGRANGSVR